MTAADTAGPARSADGHDVDHYADDLAAVTAHLDLKNAIHVGHSTGGGEIVHYIARHGESRVSKAAIISAVPPLMVRTPANPKGLPQKVFDDFPGGARSEPLTILPRRRCRPFYNYNKLASHPKQPLRTGGGRA
jgi:non-heme chloroperoxidase